jgi:hypothetical protein
MWEENDKMGFSKLCRAGIGQITKNLFGSWIDKLCRDEKQVSYLEIGTWNGLGSTKCFVDTLITRKSPFIFYSLECNKEKSSYAASLYKNISNVHILNEVIWNVEPDNFYDIFPQCKTNTTYKHWHKVDIENMKKCNLFLKREGIPDIFDVVLLDGGEFTTYHEFQSLKTRCKYLLLDDTNSDKCKLIVKEIVSFPQTWQILEHNKTERNGFLVCKRND